MTTGGNTNHTTDAPNGPATGTDGTTPVWDLAGYRIGNVIGRGGFATVYQAEQLSLNRQVAVKILMADLASDADRRRFDRERLILSRLGEHPHVIDIYDAGISPERRPYLVMRLYRRGTLADHITRTGPLPPPHVAAIITKLASALDTAHTLGVLHRDIKPENVLLTDTGEPVLADFGISAIQNNGPTTHHGQASTTFFTISYAAPEILEHGTFSIASDVYALAATAYYLTTGRPPFDGTNLRSMTSILDTPPPPITRPDIPPPFATTITQGLAKHPTQRPPTPGHLAHALTQTLTRHPTPPPAPRPARAQPVQAPAPPPPAPTVIRQDPATALSPRPGTDPAPTTPRRRTRTVAWVVLPLVLAVLGLGGWWWPGENGLAVRATVPKMDRPIRTVPLSGPVKAVEAYPTKGIAAVLDDTGQVTVVNPSNGLKLRTLSGSTSDKLQDVCFSPDGKFLAGTGPGSQTPLWVDGANAPRLRLSTGTASSSTLGPGRLVAFNTDSSRLVVREELSTQVQIWDVISGTKTASLPLSTIVQDIAMSADGLSLLVLRTEGVSIFSMGSRLQPTAPTLAREIVFPTPLAAGKAAMEVSPDGHLLAVSGSVPGPVATLWDLRSGTQVGELKVDRSTGYGTAEDLAFSPDSGLLVVVSEGRGTVWRVSTHELQARINTPASLTDVDFTSDGAYLIAGTTKPELQVWAAPQ